MPKQTLAQFSASMLLILLLAVTACSDPASSSPTPPAAAEPQTLEAAIDDAPSETEPDAEPTQGLQETPTIEASPDSEAAADTEDNDSAPVSDAVYPGRERAAYFDILPGLHDLPEAFWLDFKPYYEASRFTPERYTLRVVFAENDEPGMGYYLTAQVTVTEPDLLNSAVLQKNLPNLQPLDYPQLGRESIVLSGTRHAVRALAWENVLVEVMLLGGHPQFSTDIAYELAAWILGELPESLPAPGDFQLELPEETYSMENSGYWLRRFRFHNLNTGDDPTRLAPDVYADTHFQYGLNYPAREFQLAMLDTESGEYVYQRWKKSAYTDYQDGEGSTERMVDSVFSMAFDMMPDPGFYEYRAFVDEALIWQSAVEIYTRDQP